jgi:hypothetical protein
MADAPGELASAVGAALRAGPADVEWSVSVRDAGTGLALAEVAPDRVMPAADLSMVAAGLGLDPLAHMAHDRGLRLRHKTGTDHGVRADAGLLDGPRRRLAYAVLARFDDARRDGALAVMRAIGTAMQERCQAPFLRQRGSAT